LQIALEVPHHYRIEDDNKKINVDSVQENLIIKICDIVSVQAKDVDLEYATRDTFQTDTAISARLNGALKLGGEKKLQPWEGDANGDFGCSLELDTQGANGWDANEMFSLNEKEHGIKTTFKDNLESYTVQIDKSNADDYKEKEKEAARIAAEIENNPATRDRLDLENGDEEAAFAAVVRPADENEKTTPPPPNNNSQKYTSGQQQQNKQSNRQQQQQQQQQQERKIVPQGGKPIYSKTAPMQPQQGAVQQTINAGGFKTITINPPLAQQYQQPPPTHYTTTQNQQQQQQSQNENKNVNNNESNNNSNANNKPVQQQQQQQQQRPVRMMNTQIPMTFSEPPPNLNPVGNQHMGKPPVMGVHMPPPHEGQQAIHVVQPQVIIPPGTIVMPQPVHTIHAAPQAQRPPRETMIRTRNEDIRSLRQFQNDFNLAQAPPQVVSQQQLQQPPPQVPTTQQDMNSMVEIKSQHHPTPSSTPHSIADKAQTPPTVATPSLQNSSSGNSSSNSNDTSPPSSNDKSGLGGSKKFTLNPQAKPFTPRSPSTPTQSR
jgi:ataxin 2/2L